MDPYLLLNLLPSKVDLVDSAGQTRPYLQVGDLKMVEVSLAGDQYLTWNSMIFDVGRRMLLFSVDPSKNDVQMTDSVGCSAFRRKVCLVALEVWRPTHLQRLEVDLKVGCEIHCPLTQLVLAEGRIVLESTREIGDPAAKSSLSETV